LVGFDSDATDSRRLRVENLNGQERRKGAEFLMPRVLLIGLLALGANLLAAQQPITTSSKAEATKPPTGTLSYEPATVAAAIRSSYYHPEEMSSLDCTVSVDCTAFFSALKSSPTADRLKAIQNLKIRSQAARGKKPVVTFEWAGGPLDSREQFEDGLNQMLDGFYQMYWSMIASPPDRQRC
jgi:hypothetical protein